ncbi:MAG: F0F1 ATP synthase subunit delta [Erysipelotrichaceae bacterium]
MDSISAQGYGIALYELGKEENACETYKLQLAMMRDVLIENPDLWKILSHPKISREEKKTVVSTIFNKDISHTILNFVYLLLDKNRISSLPSITKAYMNLYNEDHNIEIAYVKSAKPLTKKELDDLKKMLEKKLNKEIEFEIGIDETLLAGLRVRIKDEVIDNSAKSRLQRLKNNVLQVNLGRNVW